ncbi:hypothetical protein Xcel_2811 [Xylanimonas cellulosilytica DSM 15894]|uniref:Uncharacterized protein n=1 Tax=Xylanimonas cellulosilytica (strain DSM 15894 / JCM 12276 / CECT 5975 / KCTC 9989 / LMG 20990 / NBRC 107835 / XIL07) TaxID=446471 RepID=D1BYF3_XYLCX|nr:hypothetical protein [Xylanimonas cellulosilytica]ACZ31825.1 hypothetical protein Xcel_2811 [Xylanimonas cellulosilytica DSM 15894]
MATSAAGLAALALFVLVLGYWVPLRVRQRQELAEARVDDRFSAGLRVLAVGARGPVPALAGAPSSGASVGAAPSGRAGLMTGATLLTGATPEVPIAGLLEMAATPLPITVPVRHDAREETPMAPPQTTARSSRRALLEARAKRARRRLTLTLVLFVATAAAWAAVPLTTLLWYGALVPSVLLAVVLGLGRAAAASARRSDARWAAEQRAAERRALQARALAAGGTRAPMNRARVTGRAVRGSSAMTQMLPRVAVKVVDGEAVEGRASGTVRAGDGGAEVAADASATASASADKAGSMPGSADGAGRTADDASRGADATVRTTDAAGRRADAADAATGATARAAEAAGRSTGATPFAAPTLGRPWEPRPVPLPTYVTKQAAPHREPRPLTGTTSTVSTGWSSSPWQRVEDAAEEVGEANTSWTLGAARPAPTPAPATPAPAKPASSTPAPTDPLATPEPRPTTETLGLPLDQILARRRAAG